MQPHLRLDIAVSYDLLGAIEQELRRAALHPLDAVYAADVAVAVLVPSRTSPRCTHASPTLLLAARASPWPTRRWRQRATQPEPCSA